MRGTQGSGFGGMLSSVLGSIVGRGGAGSAEPQPTGGGVLGGILGGLFEGGEDAGRAAPAPAQRTLDDVSAMITSGSPSSPDHHAALQSILQP